MVGRAGGNNFDDAIRKSMKPEAGEPAQKKQQSNPNSSTNAAPSNSGGSADSSNQWDHVPAAGKMVGDTGAHDTHAEMIARGHEHQAAVHAHLAHISRKGGTR